MTPSTFHQWIALAMPWLIPPPGHEPGTDYRNLRAAYEAGFKAGQESR